tara:strand:+ start:274 stop:546 length:273 start_codon:yes stop_codon:yes gene_type:complete
MGDWREYIIDFLGDYWELKGRPDLFNDVVDHVLNVYPERILEESYGQDRTDVVLLGEAFAFLQTHCTSAVSSQDLEFMALTEKERLLTMT